MTTVKLPTMKAMSTIVKTTGKMPTTAKMFQQQNCDSGKDIDDKRIEGGEHDNYN